MASNDRNIYAAEPLATGSLLVAPLGTAGPTSASAPLNAAFRDLGNIGEDGFTETINRSTDKKKNFGGRVVKILQTDYEHMIKFVLLETLNPDVLATVYGSENVTTTPANSSHGFLTTVKKNANKLPRRSWVIDTVDTELDAFYRSYIPIAQVTELGDVKLVHTDTIAYDVTLEVFADASGNHVYTMADDGQVQAGGS